MTLTELGTKHGTDKVWHDYTSIYPQYLEHLRNETGKMVEFGIAGGHSLRMWREYLPFFSIFGIDHTQPFVDAMFNIDPPISVHHGDVSEPEFLERFTKLWTQDGRLFDFCVDDASHNVWATFQALKHGWPLLKPGGYWFIEDCHAGFDPAYRRDNVPHGLPEYMTIMDVVTDLCKGRLHENGDSQCGRQTLPTSDIESVTYFKSLIIIRKRKP